MDALPYKISTLVYLRNREDELLLMRRNKAPNDGYWSPIGGKLEMETGESPYETAIREVAEETGHRIQAQDLHLFAMIAEKNYENVCHWLMFLFDCRRPLEQLPPPINEGTFAFFPESAIGQLHVPETDRKALWPAYFNNRRDFTVFRADCHVAGGMSFEVEEQMRLSPRESGSDA